MTTSDPTTMEHFRATHLGEINLKADSFKKDGVSKSVEHEVVINANMERYSVAYFLCPSYDSPIGSFREPSIYRKFTFREYRDQVQDVRKTGYKVGLPRFLVKGTVDLVTGSKESKAWVYIQQASRSTVR